MDKSQSQDVAKITSSQIIRSIRETRDQLITELLNDSSLLSYLEEHYDIVAISPIKLEFLKRDLKELQNSSLDLVHYASIMKEMKESNTDIAQNSHPLFHQELKTVMQK